MLSRRIINALLPEGKFWEPKTGDDYDLLLDGIAENSDSVISDLSELAYLRDPYRTSILSDLEKEYGIINIDNLTDDMRRARLASLMFRNSSSGAFDVLQEKLRLAGFDDINVYANSPAADPTIIKGVAGQLIINSDLDDDFTYIIPSDSGYWGLFFFIGGTATRDGTGKITSIADYLVSDTRRIELRRIVLRYKPLHAWGILITRYFTELYFDGTWYLDGLQYFDGSID